MTTATDLAKLASKGKKTRLTVRTLRWHVSTLIEEGKISFNSPLPKVKELKTESKQRTVEDDLAEYQIKTADSQHKKMYNELRDKFLLMKDQMDYMLQLSECNIRAQQIALESETSSEAIPFTIWSDWHVGKHIKPDTVQGLNEYNPDIAVKRSNKLFNNTVKMVRLHQSHTTINSMVLHLGGDFIEGYLRDYNMQENTMSPIEEVMFASERIISGINFLLNNLKIKRLYILCSRGNHSRLTKKMQSNDHRVNFETLIYYNVLQAFASESRVQIMHPEGDIGVFEIMGKKVRFIHGEKIQYMGGLGGLTIPLRKAIMNWDMTMPCDYTLMCHFHQSYKPLSNVMLNGSLCGYDNFAYSVVKAPYQAPLQSMELLVKNRGFRMFTSVDCS